MENYSALPSEQVNIKEIIAKIREWFYYLLGKWVIIVLAGIIGVSLGFWYAHVQKSTYTATLSFAMEDDKGASALGGAMGLASQFGIDVGGSVGGVFAANNIIELMKSRTLMEKALLDPIDLNGKKVSFAAYYLEMTGTLDIWKKMAPELAKIRFLANDNRVNYTLLQDSILGTIYLNIVGNNVSISQRNPKVGILYLSVKSEDQLFSKFFAETLAAEVADLYMETKTKKSKQNVAILQTQVDSIKNELNNAITGVAMANDVTYNLNPALVVKKAPSVRRQVDVQTNTAILTELTKSLELSKVTLQRETPLIQIIDKPILPLGKEKIRKMKAMAVGGFLTVFITMLLLVGVKLYKKIIA